MQEHNEFEMTDDELNTLLDRWKAPAAPASLRKSVFPKRFWALSIHIPVPAVVFLLLLLLAWTAVRSIPDRSPRSTFASLVPVSEVKIKIIKGSHAQN